MVDNSQLSQLEIDMLKECGNIGIGNAVTALSELVNKKVEISLPETKAIPFYQFSKEFGGPEEIVLGIYLPISGDLKGESIFVLDHASALKLVDLIFQKNIGTTNELDELNKSALNEMSNIFLGAYLTSISNFLDLSILPSLPVLAVDMSQAIIDLALINMAKTSDELFLVKEKILIDDEQINGTFVFILEDESVKKMLEKIKERYSL